MSASDAAVAAVLASLCPRVSADVIKEWVAPNIQSLPEPSDWSASRLPQAAKPATTSTVVAGNDSSDAELNRLRAEMDRIRELVNQKRLDVKRNRSDILNLEAQSHNLLLKANAMALRRARITLPIEVLTYICSLAYRPRNRLLSLAKLSCKPAPGDVWDQICCAVIPDILYLRGSHWNSSDDLRRALDACEPSRLHVCIGNEHYATNPDIMKTALEYRNRWREFTIYTSNPSETAVMLRQCSDVLPLLRKLEIIEERYSPGLSTSESWRTIHVDYLPRSSMIQSAYSPISFIQPGLPLYSNLIHLTVHFTPTSYDIAQFRSAFHGLHSLRTLKIFRQPGTEHITGQDTLGTYQDQGAMPNHDVLPNLKDLVVDCFQLSPEYVKFIFQCIPCKGLQKITVDFTELRAMDSQPDRSLVILKELIEQVNTRYPNLSHLSMVARLEARVRLNSSPSVATELIKLLSKLTSKGGWVLPLLTKITVRLNRSMISDLVDLVRQREENPSTLTLDVLEIHQLTGFLDYKSFEELSSYVRDIVIVRSES